MVALNVFGNPLPEAPAPVASAPGQLDLFAVSKLKYVPHASALPDGARLFRKCNRCGDRPPVVYDGELSPRGCPVCHCPEFTILFEENHEMVTAVPKARKTKKQGAEKDSSPTSDRPASPGPGPAQTVEDLSIELIDIVPGLNPRKDFDPVAMCDLADTIVFHKGLLQPVIVRPKEGGRYDLLAGERRFRACRDHCHMKTIFARIVTCDDELQAAITDDENRARVQLNPIEAAESMHRRFKASGKSQKAFGESIGISQGEVSNQLRLLQLPAEFQEMVRKGDLVPSDARSIVPFVDLANVMADLLKACTASEGRITSDDFRRLLNHATTKHSRPLSGSVWNGERMRQIHLELTPQVGKALDVRECPLGYSKNSEPRCFNLDAWDVAQAKWESDREAKRLQDAENEAQGIPSDGNVEAGTLVRPIDPVVAKEQFERNLRHYKLTWTQRQIANALPMMGILFKSRLLLHFLVSRQDSYIPEATIVEILERHGVSLVRIGKEDEVIDLYTATADCDDVEGVWTSFLQYFIQEQPDKWASEGMTPEFISDLADSMDIGFGEWKVDREFLAILNDEQLAQIVKEWKLKKAPTNRADLDEFILSQTGLPIPRCLSEIDYCQPTPTPSDDADDDE